MDEVLAADLAERDADLRVMCGYSLPRVLARVNGGGDKSGVCVGRCGRGGHDPGRGGISELPTIGDRFVPGIPQKRWRATALQRHRVFWGAAVLGRYSLASKATLAAGRCALWRVFPPYLLGILNGCCQCCSY